ncbi:MAG: HAD family phosphatase [Longicatena sp.]
MIEAIIFDCDGVIIDSEVIYLESLVDYLKTLSIECTIKDVQLVVGKPILDIAATLQKQFNLYDYTLDEIIIGQRKVFHERFYNSPLSPMQGLVEFLDSCSSKNIKIAVASSSQEGYVVDLLERFNIKKYFNVIVTGEQVTHGKPAPDIFLLASNKLGINKKNTVVIEDSYNGINAGINAEIFTIGFKGSKLVQDTSNANIEAYSFKEVEQIISTL